MAATALVREVVRRISVRLQDVRPQFRGWTEREIVDAINDAQVAIVTALPAKNARLDTIKLKPGTRQSIAAIAAADCKPGDGSTQTGTIRGIQVVDVLRTMGADGLSPGGPLRNFRRDMMDAQAPQWHATTGASPRQWCFDPTKPHDFYVYPGVRADVSAWVELLYTVYPRAIPNTGTVGAELYKADGTNSTVISIDDEFVDDIVNMAVSRLLLKQTDSADADKAAAAQGMVVDSLASKHAAITGHNPNLGRRQQAQQPLARAK